MRGKMPSSPSYTPNEPMRGRMPSAPAVTPSEKDLPSDSGWDTADTVTSLPKDIPPGAIPTPIPTPAPTPKGGITAPISSAPSPPPTPTPSPAPSPAAQTQSARPLPPPAASTSPGGALAGLSAPQREEVWAIVRAAIGEATTPMLSKQRELEERVMRAEQAAASASAKASSIPVTGPSLSPDGPRPPQKSMRLSVPPGVYGVAVIDPGEQKPAIDLANAGPIHDMPNFAGRSKLVSKAIAAVIILVVAGAVISMIVSRS
jgi:hypothetical protein